MYNDFNKLVKLPGSHEMPSIDVTAVEIHPVMQESPDPEGGETSRLEQRARNLMSTIEEQP